MSKRYRPRRGMALLLVLSVVGLTVVLGIAMLATASLQVHAAHNTALASQADALSESGLELASYYLMYPHKAPPFVGAHWPGGRGISLGAAGTVDVTVAKVGQDADERQFYSIASVGRSGGIERTCRSTIRLTPGFRVIHATAFDNNRVTLPEGSRIEGDVQVTGQMINEGRIAGTVYARQWDNDGVFAGNHVPISGSDKSVVPPRSDVRDYTTYTWKGKSYRAKAIPGMLLPGTTLRASADNPAGVFHCLAPLILYSDTRIEGTLVVNGALAIYNRNNSIKPVEGFPAAVVFGSVDLRHSSITVPELSAEGVVWMQGSIGSSLAFGSQKNEVSPGTLSVKGALLVTGGEIENPGFLGKIVVTYDGAAVANVQLNAKKEPPSVMVTSFK